MKVLQLALNGDMGAIRFLERSYLESPLLPTAEESLAARMSSARKSLMAKLGALRRAAEGRTEDGNECADVPRVPHDITGQ